MSASSPVQNPRDITVRFMHVEEYANLGGGSGSFSGIGYGASGHVWVVQPRADGVSRIPDDVGGIDPHATLSKQSALRLDYSLARSASWTSPSSSPQSLSLMSTSLNFPLTPQRRRKSHANGPDKLSATNTTRTRVGSEPRTSISLRPFTRQSGVSCGGCLFRQCSKAVAAVSHGHSTVAISTVGRERFNNSSMQKQERSTRAPAHAGSAPESRTRRDRLSSGLLKQRAGGSCVIG